jgi:hypothetical protein
VQEHEVDVAEAGLGEGLGDLLLGVVVVDEANL